MRGATVAWGLPMTPHSHRLRVVTGGMNGTALHPGEARRLAAARGCATRVRATPFAEQLTENISLATMTGGFLSPRGDQ
jgi:hypothetical protein